MNIPAAKKEVVLVTGASGQLGQAIKAVAAAYPQLQCYYAPSAEANLTNKPGLEAVFAKLKPAYCINAAAYTAVDKAESDKDSAYAVNTAGAKNLAEVCKEHGCVLIHISTDFVFDGTGHTPYTEEDATNPQSVYGRTKRDGELEVVKALQEYIIIRTSWVYSEFANNFMKTMIRLGKERDTISVVNDQKGTPTNANDLARALLHIIQSGKKAYGIYNYSNEGEATWYDFAQKIFEVNNITIDVKPIATSAYPTPAARPAYSVLDKTKIKETFGLTIDTWQQALRKL